MAVKVRLKDGSNNVLHPETDWSVVLSRPSITRSYYESSHDTSSSSKLNAMSKWIGISSEAWDTYSNSNKGIIIGNRYNALGLYGSNTTAGKYITTLQSDSEVLIAAEGDIKIGSNATGNESVSLADYPINWSALKDNPFKTTFMVKNDDNSSSSPTSIQNAVFGIYTDDSGGTTVKYYPAFAIVSAQRGGGQIGYRVKGYRLNDSGVLTAISEADMSSKFSGFLDHQML